MGDYISREAVLTEIADTAHVNFELGSEFYHETRAAIKAIPAADVMEVVRCGDCKHRYVDGDNVRYNVCELNHNRVQSDDWFCADGERKEADND